MALQFTPNPRATGNLSFTANARARFSSIVSVDWDHVTEKPDFASLYVPFGTTASTTVQGVVELATDAEAKALTDTARVITPSNLAAVFGINATDPDGLFIASTGSGYAPRAILGADLPTPTTIDLGGVFARANTGAVLAGLDTAGNLLAHATISGSTSATLSGSSAGNAMLVAQTWNTSGVPVGLKVAITDTAHGAGSQIAGFYGGVAGTTALWLLDTVGNTAQIGQHGVGVASALAQYVGRQGAANPAWQVDTSVASCITGVKVTAQATGNGVNLDAIGETNVPLIVNAAGTGTISFGTISSGVINFFQNANINHNSTPTLTFGTSGNTKGTLKSQGSGGFEFTNSSGNVIAAFAPVAATGQVNYPRFRSNSAAGGVILDAVGTDTDIGFSVVAKGAGSVLFSTGSGVAQFQVLHTASTTSFITVTGSNGGNPTIGVAGGGNLAITPAVVGAAAINGLMAANTIKGNNTGSSATSVDLTYQQFSAMFGQLKYMKSATGINFNSANTDTIIQLPSPPTGFTRYSLRTVYISGASATLNPATCGVFTAAAGGGTALVASGTAVTVTATADSTINNMQVLSPVNVNTMSNLYSALTTGNIYFRVQTASGGAATASVTLEIQWLP